jgi:lipoprotein-releasing system ATP-binding protein
MRHTEAIMADLQVTNVSKEYATRGEPLVILREVSLELSVGENLAILGPSGSGKSTLLNILGTLDSPSSGSVTLRGQNPFTLDERGLSQFRNRNIGFVFQEHHLLPQLSVLENVLLPTIADGASSEAQVKRAKMLLERIGLTQRIEHRPAELSGGERQRVAIARALINQPVLLLADEPTGNLDRSNALSVGKLLLELQQLEKTILVVVTHSMELASIFQRRWELDNGQLKDVR